ncbi:hypothetical protein D9M68_909960 [compost metagenome]
MLKEFAAAIPDHYSAGDRKRGGFETEDRRGRKIFHPLISLSLGVVNIEPGSFVSHHQIATAASEAKRQAKKIAGNSLFVERRQPDASQI